MLMLKRNNAIIFDINNIGNIHIEDKFIAEFSIYRGPNRLIWYCYSPTPQVNLDSKIDDVYELIIGSGHKGYLSFSIELTLETISWNTDMSCYVIRFLPTSYFIGELQSIYGSLHVNTVKEFLNEILPSRMILSVTKDLDGEIYDHLNWHGTLLDLLAKIAHDFDTEFYLGDIILNVGHVYVEDTKPFPIYIHNNTLSEFKMSKDLYITFTHSTLPGPLPGGTINFPYNESENTIKRVIYNKITWSSDKGLECDMFSTDIYSHITEEQFAKLLCNEDKEILLRKYRDLKQLPSFLAKQVDDRPEEDETQKWVKTGDISRKMDQYQGRDNEMFDIRVVKSTPYAGKTVGMQFPNTKEDDSVHSINVSHQNNTNTVVEVGQVYQKDSNGNVESPKRNSEDDFRLTLPDGGTLYYDHENGTWIMAAKTNIKIGVVEDLDSESIPDPENIIEFDGTNIYINGDDSSPAAARVGDTTSPLPTFKTFIETLKSALTGGPATEPGNGAPSVFNTTLKSILTSLNIWESGNMGEISSGSDIVNIGD